MGNRLWKKAFDNPLARDVFTTTAWSVLGKGIGFTIPFFIAAWFGITNQTDIFFFAYGIILFIVTIIIPIGENIIVPYIAEARSSDRDVGSFIGGVLAAATVGLIILIGIFLLAMKPLLSIVTRFDKQSLKTVYMLLLEITPLIVLSVWSSVLVGSMNAYKKFNLPAISPAFRAIVNLIFIYIFKGFWGIHAIAWGYVAGEAVRVSILLWTIYKLRLFSISFHARLSGNVREFFKTASFQVIGLIAFGFNPIVDQAMASWLGTGNISVLYYADRIYAIPLTIGISGLSVVLLSEWSKKYYTNKDTEALFRDSLRTIKIIALIAILATVLFCLFSGWMIRVVYGAGSISADMLTNIRSCFIFFVLGLTPYLVATVVINVHQVLKHTKVVMQWAFFSVAANILLNLVLMKYMGVAGLAFSTTFVCAIGTVYLLRRLYKDTVKN